MSCDNSAYHREREQHCRSMAELAIYSDVRRRHEQLADLHAGQAALHGDGSSGEELSSI